MKKENNTTKKHRKHMIMKSQPIFICLADSENGEFNNEKLVESSAKWLNKTTDWARVGFYENK